MAKEGGSADDDYELPSLDKTTVNPPVADKGRSDSPSFETPSFDRAGDTELVSARTQELRREPGGSYPSGSGSGGRVRPPASHDDPTLIPSDTHPTRPDNADDAWDKINLPDLPDHIGRFVVRRRLGAGGMGLVFEAHDQTLDRRIAVKLLRTDSGGSQSDEASTRLLREAQALARLSHPNVIQVYEVGTFRGQVFVAMEYIDGETLDLWQRDPDLKWLEILRVYLDAARGLAAAHDAGIVHRDFKPTNVMRARDGRVVVLDFGLAHHSAGQDFEDAQTHVSDKVSPSAHLRARAEESRSMSTSALTDHFATPLTATGAVMGTPAYMSPEQHEGLPTDARTDQFSLCVSLWEGLYGERPFEGSSLPVLMTSVLEGRIRKLPDYATQVPPFVQEGLVRGLAVAPDARYPHLAALIVALDHGPHAGRSRRTRFLAAAALVAAGALGWWVSGLNAELPLDGARANFLAGLSESAAHGQRLDMQGHGAESSSHWDALVLAHAREALVSDPTEAMASLRHLSPENHAWVNSARVIAAEARTAGVAWRVHELGLVSQLIFSSLGDRALVVNEEGTLLRWEIDEDVLSLVETGDAITTFALAGHGRMAIALRADGHLMEIVLSGDGSTRVSDTGLRQQCKAAHLVLDQEGQRLYVGCDGTLGAWVRRAQGWERESSYASPDRILDLCAVGDELALLHGTPTKAGLTALALVDGEFLNREVIMEILGAERLVGAAHWSGLAIVASAGLVAVPPVPAQLPPVLVAAGVISIYDRGAAGLVFTDGRRVSVSTGGEPIRLRGHSAPIRYLRAATVESRVMSVDASGHARVWRPGIGVPRIALQGGGGTVTLDVSERGDILVSGAADGSVRRLRLSQIGQAAQLLGKHPGELRIVDASPDGTWVASMGQKPGVRVWSEPGEEALRFGAMRQPAKVLAWSDDGSVVAAAACTIAETCGAELFWPATGRSQWVHGLARAPVALSFSPRNERLVAVEPSEGGARVWRAELERDAARTGPEGSSFDHLSHDFGRVVGLAHDAEGWITIGAEAGPQKLELWRVSPAGRSGLLATIDEVGALMTDHGVLAWQRGRTLHLYDMVRAQSATLVDVGFPVAAIMMRRGGEGVAIFSELEESVLTIDLESRERRRVPAREKPYAWGLDFFDSPGSSLRAFDDRAPQEANALAHWVGAQTRVWVDPAKMHRSVLKSPEEMAELEELDEHEEKATGPRP